MGHEIQDAAYEASSANYNLQTIDLSPLRETPDHLQEIKELKEKVSALTKQVQQILENQKRLFENPQ
jgi:polyhydroxyalkanoate synthesis regulator phasin